MITLVADVGGTQSRLGFVNGGVLDETSVRHFRNNKFNSFYERYIRSTLEIRKI